MPAPSAFAGFFRKSKPWLITCAALLALVLLVQQLAKPDSPEGAGKGPRSAVGADYMVSARRVALTDLPVYYNALGTVTAYNTVLVRSRVVGELTKVLFEEGQMVKAGDLLAQIDPRSYGALLNQAEGTLQQNQAQLHNAQIDLERYRGLFAEDSTATAQHLPRLCIFT